MIRAHQRLERRGDLCLQVFLDALAVVERRFAIFIGRSRAARPVQQVAARVYQRHLLGRELRDRARRELADRRDILGRKPRPRPQLHQNAGLRRLPGLRVQRILGHRDVHPRLLHLANRHDGAFEFALNRPVIVHLFGEIARAEIGLIEQLVADPPGFREAQDRHRQARLREPRGGDQDRRSVVPQPVVEAAFLQFGDQPARVFRRQIRIQRLVVALVVPPRKRNQPSSYGQHGDQNPHPLRPGELVPDSFQRVHLFCLVIVSGAFVSSS